MLDPQDQKIIERYKALPQPLKDALWAEETIDHIFDVGKAQKLTVSQMGELADIVGLVILGILKPEDFGSEVQRKLNLTMERASAADAIVAAINEKIFTPLRDEIINATRAPTPPSPPLVRVGEEKKQDILSPRPQIKSEQTPLAAPTTSLRRSAEGGPALPQATQVSRQVGQKIGYQGRDPYREPIDEKAPTSLMPQPPSVAPTQPISIFAKQIPSPAPQATQVSGPRQQQSSLAGGQATPQAAQVGGQAKPISWADISPEKEKASSPPDAKSALERAMNDGTVTPRPQKPTLGSSTLGVEQSKTPSVFPPSEPPPNLPTAPEKTNAQKYQEKAAPTGEPHPGYTGRDPYREPIE